MGEGLMLFPANLDRCFHEGSDLRTVYLKHRPLHLCTGTGLTEARRPVGPYAKWWECVFLRRQHAIFLLIVQRDMKSLFPSEFKNPCLTG